MATDLLGAEFPLLVVTFAVVLLALFTGLVVPAVLSLPRSGKTSQTFRHQLNMSHINQWSWRDRGTDREGEEGEVIQRDR